MSYARIDGDSIVITLPIHLLANASIVPDELLNENYDPTVKVTDVDTFAADLVAELNRESEDGTTEVHALFDRAFVAAVENGSDGVDDITDNEDEEYEGIPCDDEDEEDEDEDEDEDAP